MANYFYNVEYVLVQEEVQHPKTGMVVVQSPTALGPEDIKNHIRKDLKLSGTTINLLKIEVIDETRFNSMFLNIPSAGDA